MPGTRRLCLKALGIADDAATRFPSQLKRPQESDEVSFLLLCQVQTEFVACDGVRACVVPAIASGMVVRIETVSIKPLFECGDGSVMLERTAIPHPFQRRYFVKSQSRGAYSVH